MTNDLEVLTTPTDLYLDLVKRCVLNVPYVDVEINPINPTETSAPSCSGPSPRDGCSSPTSAAAITSSGSPAPTHPTWRTRC